QHGAVAAALDFVQVLAARGTKALAVLVADRRGRYREEDLLADGGSEIDLLAGIALFVGGLGLEARVLALALAQLAFGRVLARQLDRLVQQDAPQAALALPLERHREPGLHQDLAAHLGD